MFLFWVTNFCTYSNSISKYKVKDPPFSLINWLYFWWSPLCNLPYNNKPCSLKKPICRPHPLPICWLDARRWEQSTKRLLPQEQRGKSKLRNRLPRNREDRQSWKVAHVNHWNEDGVYLRHVLPSNWHSIQGDGRQLKPWTAKSSKSPWGTAPWIGRSSSL